MKLPLSRIPALCLIMLIALCSGCKSSQNTKEKNMTEHHILDTAEVSSMLFHPRKVPETAAPDGAVNINIEVAPDISIGCRLFTAAREAPTILFFHGNGEIASDYDEIGPMYVKENINFLVTDFRGYGWSGGVPSFSTLLADSHTLYQKLKQYLADNGYSDVLFVMGRSLGSACAIEVASVYDHEIKGLIIESGFAETLPLAETLGMDISSVDITEEETFNNGGKIAEVTKPTFLLHGRLDTLIPLWQAEKLHAECGARSKELQVVPGADHNSLIAVGGIYYFQAIKQFVDKVTGTSDWRRRRRAYRDGDT